jgi:menaquinone-9 beta-reductase
MNTIATQVLIVGGGPAGAACAWQLRRHEVPCLVLDRAIFPRVKPCAGWITPEVFQYLELTPNAYPHSLTTFTSFEISLRGVRFRLPTRQYAIRRVEFDAWLLKRSGVEVIQHQVQQVRQIAGSYLVDERFSARFIIGAGGTHCPVRRALFVQDTQEQGGRLIVTKEEEFPYPYKDNRCRLWFFEDGLPGYAWYVPKADGYLNVGLGANAARLRSTGQTLNAHWSRLVEKLDRERLISGYPFQPLGYSYRLRSRSPQPRLGNAFLVGDGLGLATKDMGEGIGPAIHSGLLAADAIIHNQPYQVRAIPQYSFPSILSMRRKAR